MTPIKKTSLRRATARQEKNITSGDKKNVAPRVIKPVEIKPDKPTALPNPSLRFYRRVSGAFVGVVALVLLAVVFLSTTKAIIKVTPLSRSVEAGFLVGVVKEGPGSGQIIGTVVEQILEQTKSIPVAGTEPKEVLDKSGGEITIINTSSHNQPLVATTRFLSSGGVLFRLDKSVMVPAGGRVVAVVHADQVGSTGDIGPDKFTIPGLATSLQAQIYAESSVAMVGGQRMVFLVSQESIDSITSALEEQMLSEAKEQMRVGKSLENREAFTSEVISKNCDTKPGEEKDSVTVSLKIKVTGVFFDTGILNELASAKIIEQLEDGFILKDSGNTMDNIQSFIEGDGTIIELVSADSQTGKAELSLLVKKDSIVSNTSSFLQPEVLAGKSLEEIKKYLVSAGVASDVQVKIFPPWIKTVPKMLDQISVEVLE